MGTIDCPAWPDTVGLTTRVVPGTVWASTAVRLHGGRGRANKRLCYAVYGLHINCPAWPNTMESYHAWLASQLSDHAGYDVAWVTCGWLRGSGTRNTQREDILTPTAELARCGAVFVGQTTDKWPDIVSADMAAQRLWWERGSMRRSCSTYTIEMGNSYTSCPAWPDTVQRGCTGEERERCLSGINCPAKPDAVWADVRQAGRGGQQRVGTQADNVRFGWIHGLGNLRLAERRCATYLNNKA
ncbi:hypothetical protein F5887DRAFT_925169 [Amanita rubescens]|nr:hypothetical protein F5887DRAFT_925169 [Amanita rubescens]